MSEADSNDSASWETFNEVDPYNPQNTVNGEIRRSGRKTYGMLRINSVNGKDCYQEIYCTPKMGYPHSDTGFYRTTKDDEILVYEKYDGTNIFAFGYYDGDGHKYVSYKTRLKPFLGQSKFGDFKSLWDEILAKDDLKNTLELLVRTNVNLSFELYGKRNKILIDYPVSLDYVLLFGVVEDGMILSPSSIFGAYTTKFKTPELMNSFSGGDDFENKYTKLREELNSKLIVVKTTVDGEEKVESMSGLEGAVVYVCGKSGYCVQLKAKPDAVLDIHWAAKGIPYHAIYTTILNAFELSDNPTPQMIDELLKEEFDESDICKRRYTIAKMLSEVRFEKILKLKIFSEYKENNFDIVADKRTCMRWFGERYDKKIAGKIYGHLMNEFGTVI